MSFSNISGQRQPISSLKTYNTKPKHHNKKPNVHISKTSDNWKKKTNNELPCTSKPLCNNALLNEIPFEIFEKIVFNLNYVELLQLAYVCKTWSQQTIACYGNKMVADLQKLSAIVSNVCKAVHPTCSNKIFSGLRNTMEIHTTAINFALSTTDLKIPSKSVLELNEILNYTQGLPQYLTDLLYNEMDAKLWDSYTPIIDMFKRVPDQLPNAEILKDLLLELENVEMAYALMERLFNKTCCYSDAETRKIRAQFFRRFIETGGVETALLLANKLEGEDRSQANEDIFYILISLNNDFATACGLVPKLACDEDRLRLLIHYIWAQLDDIHPSTVQWAVFELLSINIDPQLSSKNVLELDCVLCWTLIKALSTQKEPELRAISEILERIETLKHDLGALSQEGKRDTIKALSVLKDKILPIPGQEAMEAVRTIKSKLLEGFIGMPSITSL